MYREIQEVLSPPIIYSEMVKCYQKYGNDALVLTLCKGSENSFSFAKIKSGLEALAATVQDEEVAITMLDTIIVKEKPKWKRSEPLTEEQLKDDKIRERRDKIGPLFKECIALRKILHEVAKTSDRRPITMEDCFALMDQTDKHGEPIPFTLWYFIFNENEKTGGRFFKSFATLRHSKKEKSFRFSKKKTEHNKNRINPNHSIHGTFNIQLVNTFEFRKVHSWLIMQINDQPVTLGNYG